MQFRVFVNPCKVDTCHMWVPNVYIMTRYNMEVHGRQFGPAEKNNPKNKTCCSYQTVSENCPWNLSGSGRHQAFCCTRIRRGRAAQEELDDAGERSLSLFGTGASGIG